MPTKGSLANGAYTKIRGNDTIERHLANAISFGELFLANPDLPERFKGNSALNKADTNTFYTQDAQGYTDYPAL